MQEALLHQFLRCSPPHPSLLPLLLLLFLPTLTLTYPLRSHTLSRDITFPQDYLSPYPPGRHGSRRTTRDISNCLHTTWQNRTFETFKLSTVPPRSEKVSYHLHKFADITERILGPKYLVGTIAYVEEPYHTFSVLEPGGKGGCSWSYGGSRKTVGDTVSSRGSGCRLAANAGYFSMLSGECLGNVVSDGRIVRTTGDEQNANFGIREDGTIVVGYIPDEDILNTTNPFRQLLTGIVWLVRNGTNFVNESKKLECESHEGTGRMDTFVDVLSARTALGHDAQGRLVLAQIEGQTHRRGANLVEFADLLIRHGVVNAINLDGGGSNTVLEDGVLINYPSDHCVGDAQYRCPRPVSTVLCVHDVQCLDPECSGHGRCERTECLCDYHWTGVSCQSLNCSTTDCSGHGNCSNRRCECDAGWMGELCSEACPRNRYGQDCKEYCWCFGNAHCHPTTGHCICPPGFTGFTCIDKCTEGFYGTDCKEECAYPHCSGHGHCSNINGSCLCDKGWTGESCNTSSVSGGDEGSGAQLGPLFSTVSPSLSLIPSLTFPTALPHPTPQQNVSLECVTVCDCRRPYEEEGTGVGTNCNNTAQSSKAVGEDATIMQWTVAISLLISLTTLIIHVLFCWATRRWAYMAACRTQGDLLPSRVKTEGLLGKKKKLKRRKPRPKYRVPLMLQYSSSTDCSL